MPDYNICIVGQRGRIEVEALLFVLSVQKFSPEMLPKIYVCTPVNSPLWPSDPNMKDGEIADVLRELGVHIVEFENSKFGMSYPHSNKMYAVSALPPNEPFVFFDSDHVVFKPFGDIFPDFSKPTARRASKIWPRWGVDEARTKEIWDSIYAKFGLETKNWYQEDAIGVAQFPYFNGGCFFGANAGVFFEHYRKFMHELADDQPAVLEGQKLFPNLDQICLPLVYNAIGGSPLTYRGNFVFSQISAHYFKFANLYTNNFLPARQVAEEIMFDDAYRRFFENAEWCASFFGEGRAKAVRMLKNLSGKPEFDKKIRARFKKAKLWR